MLWFLKIKYTYCSLTADKLPSVVFPSFLCYNPDTDTTDLEVKDMKRIIPLLLLPILLTACATTGSIKTVTSPTPTPELPATSPPDPPETETPLPPTELQPPPTGSPIPRTLFPTSLNPDPALLEMWQKIELALGTMLLDFALERGPVLCEWELLGLTDLEVYLYVLCKATVPLTDDSTTLPSADMPAVIHLGENGEIQEVEIPGPGTLFAEDIRRMFPPEAQVRIFDDLINYQQMGDHLLWRLDHPQEPPLFVLNTTPQP